LGSSATQAADLGSPSRTRNPPSTPSQSPTATAMGPPLRDPPPQSQTMYPKTGSGTTDFFEDELRGYRLLRASRISGQERQNILVQTSNSTSFNLVRRALRTLYAEETDRSSSKPSGRIWFEEWDYGYDDGEHVEDAWWSEWDDWAEWSHSSQAYWCDDNWNDGWDYGEAADEMLPDS